MPDKTEKTVGHFFLNDLNDENCRHCGNKFSKIRHHDIVHKFCSYGECLIGRCRCAAYQTLLSFYGETHVGNVIKSLERYKVDVV